MPPFAHFRLWLREGPRAERTAACAAAAITLVLVALALVPISNGSTSLLAGVDGGSNGVGTTTGSTTGGAASTAAGGTAGTVPAAQSGAVTGGAAVGAPGAAGAAGAPGTAGAVAGGAAGSTAVGSSTATGGACGQRIASANGITATTVTLDAAVVQLAGAVGNSAFNIRPDQDKIFNAVVDYVNHNGGVACGRKLIIKQYNVNPTDANDQQSKCLQMVGDKPLAVINDAGYVTPASFQCFVDHRLPIMAGISLSSAQARHSFPYLFGTFPFTEEQVRNGILGLAARGYFKPPKFTKIGILEDACLPAANQEIARDLAASGVKSSQISTYVLDCNLVAPPNQIQQAVVQQRGASHVFLASSILNDQNYVRLAAQQQFRPQYMTSDYGSPTASAGSWDPAYNGAVAITSLHTGELNSGLGNAARSRCNKILVDRGVPGIRNEQTDESAAGICDSVLFMVQAINHAGANPSQTGVVQTLGTMGKYAASYVPDSEWSQPGKVAGGDYQRSIRYISSCTCYHVIDRTFGRSY